MKTMTMFSGVHVVHTAEVNLVSMEDGRAKVNHHGDHAATSTAAITSS